MYYSVEAVTPPQESLRENPLRRNAVGTSPEGPLHGKIAENIVGIKKTLL